jgi:hypothetical protein
VLIRYLPSSDRVSQKFDGMHRVGATAGPERRVHMDDLALKPPQRRMRKNLTSQ